MADKIEDRNGEDLANDSGFRVGKTYQHQNGRTIRIVGFAQTWHYGLCLVGERDDGSLRPVSIDEGAFDGWALDSQETGAVEMRR